MAGRRKKSKALLAPKPKDVRIAYETWGGEVIRLSEEPDWLRVYREAKAAAQLAPNLATHAKLLDAAINTRNAHMRAQSIARILEHEV